MLYNVRSFFHMPGIAKCCSSIYSSSFGGPVWARDWTACDMATIRKCFKGPAGLCSMMAVRRAVSCSGVQPSSPGGDWSFGLMPAGPDEPCMCDGTGEDTLDGMRIETSDWRGFFLGGAMI